MRDWNEKQFKCEHASYHMKSFNECMNCAVTFCEAHPYEYIPVVTPKKPQPEGECIGCYMWRDGCKFKHFESTAGYHCARDEGPIEGGNCKCGKVGVSDKFGEWLCQEHLDLLSSEDV